MLKYIITYICLCSPAWAQSGDMPLWQQLESLSDKANAVIGFEVTPEKDPALYSETRVIENLWNEGSHGTAIDHLRLVEAAGARLSMGMAWKVPLPASLSEMGPDYPVEARGRTRETMLDFHDATGNLFTVIRRLGGDNPRWTVNLSTDGGFTWSETFAWTTASGNEVKDVAAVVADQYLYVAYNADDGTSDYGECRIRRCLASTGALDGPFGFQQVFDKGVDIEEFAFASDADALDSSLYLFSGLEDGRVIYQFANSSTASWIEIPTGINNFFRGLDASTNEGYSTNFVMISYISNTGRLNVGLRSGIWNVVDLDDAVGFATSITAYQDTLFVTYEYDPGAGQAIKYWISYDGGPTWLWGFVAQPNVGEKYYSPQATARRGGGISVIYSEEVGEPDPIWHRHRTYTSPANWSVPDTFNETDVAVSYDLSIEWIPPLPGGGSHAYGMAWFPNISKRPAVFDRTDRSLGPLTANEYYVSAAFPIAVNFTLDAGAGNGFRNYLMLGGVTGTAPGFALPGGFATLPLNWDPFTDFVVNFLNSVVFQNFLGVLNGAGMSTASLNAPPLSPTLVGIDMFYAFCLNAPFDFVSNPVVIKITP